MTESDYKKWVEAEENAKIEYAKAQGRSQAIIKDLADNYGCDSLEDAQELLNKLKQKNNQKLHELRSKLRPLLQEHSAELQQIGVEVQELERSLGESE